MAATPNPLAAPPAAPAVSKTTVPMAGVLVDVYGLAELPRSAAAVSCLWLHHPRTRTRGDMADIAARCVAGYYASLGGSSSSSSSSPPPPPPSRGLLALAFDQRNHGSREVHPPGKVSWREGNAAHAQDMFGMVAGTVADNVLLLDSVGSYLFHDDDAGGDDDDEGRPARSLDQHLVLGVSLGGHSAWQLVFADARVTAAVPVIGCPDFMYLLQDRARLSKLPTYRADDGGASFLGSRDFPPALVRHCQALDPKALLFGTGPVPPPPPPSSAAAGDGDGGGADPTGPRAVLGARLGGKRLLVCSGGEDRLVPYRCSEPFLAWLKAAAAGAGVAVDDRVYPGAGHEFSGDMVRDAVAFVVDVVREGPARRGEGVARI